MRELVRVAIVLFILLQLTVSSGRSAAAPFVDPIQGIAHGAGFGLDGNEIVVTADFIAQTQNLYTQHVLDSASTAQMALYQVNRSYLDSLAIGATQPRDRQVALYANSLLLDWLIDKVAPADAAMLKVRNHVLISWMERGLGYLGEGEDFALLPSDTALFVQAGIVAPGAAAAAAAPPPDKVLQARETYAKQCRKAGVPIPPTWNKDDPVWQNKGILKKPFISKDLEAELFVFTSVSPKGVCLALPRHKAPADAPNEVFGIICQGDQGNSGELGKTTACFWDNQEPDPTTGKGVTTPIPREGAFPLNTYFAAGPELNGGGGGTCTACHAGENAYVVHPRDPAFKPILGDIERDGMWYKPMVSTTWPQNPGPDTAIDKIVLDKGQKSCTTCHNLPEITKGLATPPGENYCDAVLKTALKETMPISPPRSPLGGPFNAAYKYEQHNDYLAKKCAAAKAAMP